MVTENNNLKDDLTELEKNHVQATRDLNLSKKVKVEVESSHTEKIEHLNALNTKLTGENESLIEK